ncbi:hypothetical protein BDZ97DRAFT_1836579 [Flammula alnicola]|nr:hypothetical protein BDZ97DRAFT_1836579 [Flammula alnicola]
MAFDGVFKAQFGEAVDKSLATDVPSRGAFVWGCMYGVASALIYLDSLCRSLLPRMIPWFLEWLRFHRLQVDERRIRVYNN